jgi:hypothetical protein
MTTPVPLSIDPQAMALLPLLQRTNLAALVDRLDDYVSAMGPGMPVDPRQGGSRQAALWNLIKGVLRAKPEEFTLQYSELLAVIHRHRTTVFSERYAFRFFNELKLASTERVNFERVLNVLLATCNPQTRRVAFRQVDIKNSLRSMNDEALIERVLAYYML